MYLQSRGAVLSQSMTRGLWNLSQRLGWLQALCLSESTKELGYRSWESGAKNWIRKGFSPNSALFVLLLSAPQQEVLRHCRLSSHSSLQTSLSLLYVSSISEMSLQQV